MNSEAIISCKSCGQKNRLRKRAQRGQYRCASCHGSIPSPFPTVMARSSEPSVKKSVPISFGSWGPFLGWVGGLAGTGFIFFIVNAILVGGQKAWHHSDQVQLDTLKDQLSSEGQVIDRSEKDAKATKGMTVPQFSTYLDRVNNYNAKVDQANDLSKKIGPTYYVVPGPGRRIPQEPVAPKSH